MLLRSCLLLLAVLIAGSARAFDPVPSAGAGGPTDLRAFVRFVHVGHPGQPVDLYLGNTRILNNFRYGEATDYRAIMQRRYAMALRPPNASWATRALATQPVQFVSHAYYTVLLLPAGARWVFSVLGDDPHTPPRGQDRVRFIHAARNTPPLMLATARGEAIFRGVAYGQMGHYQLIPAGVPSLVLATPTGTPVSQVAIPREARVYTVIAYATADPSVVGTLVLVGCN